MPTFHITFVFVLCYGEPLVKAKFTQHFFFSIFKLMCYFLDEISYFLIQMLYIDLLLTGLKPTLICHVLKKRVEMQCKGDIAEYLYLHNTNIIQKLTFQVDTMIKAKKPKNQKAKKPKSHPQYLLVRLWEECQGIMTICQNKLLQRRSKAWPGFILVPHLDRISWMRSLIYWLGNCWHCHKESGNGHLRQSFESSSV